MKLLAGWRTRLAMVVGILAALVAGVATSANAAPTWSTGPYRIVNVATAGHLLPNDFGLNHNDNIYIWAWNETATGDVWRLEWVDRDYYIIRNVDTGKCLRPGGPYGAKTYVTQATCSDSYDFQWVLIPRLGNPAQVQIVSRASRQALRPYYELPNQVVVLDTPSDANVNYWSLSRL